MEKWKDIKGYGGRYQVSNHGRIRSLPYTITRSNGRKLSVQGAVLRSCRMFDGKYPAVRLISGSKVRKVNIHRLVAEAFLDNPEGKPIVNHIDGDTTNNLSTNLEWVTHQENIQHSFDVGLATGAAGSANPCAKLDEFAVVNILRLSEKKGMTNKVLSEMFGVSQTIISDIKNGKRWVHVGRDEAVIVDNRKKLSSDDITDIQRDVANGVTQTELAKKYNVHPSCICKANKKET